MRLAGKIALVTGAAGGIGAAIVARFRSESAHVLATDLAEAPGLLPLDVTVPAEWQALAAQHVALHGGLDILVHNAGISGFTPFAELAPERWQAFLDVHATAVLTGTQVLCPFLEAAPGAWPPTRSPARSAGSWRQRVWRAPSSSSPPTRAGS